MSSYLEFRSPDEVGDEWKELLGRLEGSMGYVPNYAKVFALRPDAYRAWGNLVRTISSAMDQRRYELATVAAARRLRSSYCSLAHGKILADKFHTPSEVAGLYSGDETSPLDEVDRAVMNLADKVAEDATSIRAEDIDALRSLGLSDTDVFDVILAAAARCFFSKVLDATGTLPDSALRGLDEALRETLTVGRPVEEA